MWRKTYSQIYADVSKSSIWQVWCDVNNWASWQMDLDYCKMEGEFRAGNFFKLKPKGGQEFKVTLIEVEPQVKFKDCTRFWGAKMYDTHEMHETEQGLRLIHTLEVTGPFKFLWIKLVAKNVAASIPAQLQALVAQARLNHE